MRIILLGPPGSGKSAISQKIAEKFRIPVVGMEEVAEELSALANQEDEEGRQAREAIAAGRVSDEVCNLVLKRVLTKKDLSNGYVLLGYPKDAAQAEVLHTATNEAGCPIDQVLMIDIDRDELMERRVGRIDCDGCGAQYNLYVNPPMVDGVCDMCGGRLTRRPRGYEENIANQLREYDVNTQPILDYFEKQGILRYVDGNGTEEALWQDVEKALEEVKAAATEKAKQEAAKAKQAEAPEKKEAPKKKTAPKKKEAAPKKKAAAKKTVKKAASKKKAVSKKTTTKKSTSKKKTATKKAAAKKKATPARKKATTKKAAKKVVKKTTKKAAKKVVKKTTKKAAKKKVTKKAAKKTAARKTTKKAAVKKVVKKAAAKTVKKSAAKTTKKKVAKKKATAKKTATGATTRKTTAKKKTTKKKTGKR